MKISKNLLDQFLQKSLEEEELEKLRENVMKFANSIFHGIADYEDLEHQQILKGNVIEVNSTYLKNELRQIYDSRTIERAKYYTTRLIRALSDVRTSKINDINLNRWKEYSDIITDSLWVIERRDNSGAHNANYWGNFIPQIPNQFLRRYTKEGDWILDTFLGSGTTLIESKRLGRNGIGFELSPNVADLAKNNINKQRSPFENQVRTEVVVGDSTELDYLDAISGCGIKSVQFVLMHPPYWDIIKFSDDPRDLSNAIDLQSFLGKMGIIADKVNRILDSDRYCALVIGDIYTKGEWIPLAFYTMQEFLKRGFSLKSVIVKNFEETKGKKNQQELWRYRALVGGFYIFKHEYIFLFRKSNKAR